MVTVAMRCPGCESAFDVPVELAAEGHRCYKCDVPIEPFRAPTGSHRQGRRAVAGWRVEPVAVGAVLGAGATVAFGVIGGPIGSAVIGAVCGAVVGFFLAAALAFFALEDVEFLLNGARLTIWAKLIVAGGGVLGACGMGLAEDPTVLLTLGAIGGLVAGGLIGDRLVNGRRES